MLSKLTIEVVVVEDVLTIIMPMKKCRSKHNTIVNIPAIVNLLLKFSTNKRTTKNPRRKTKTLRFSLPKNRFSSFMKKLSKSSI